MNRAGEGHMILARNFTRLLGFPEVHVGQHEATRLLKDGATLAYLTLTNDHQPRTEGAHDRTLEWERSSASRPPAVPEAAAARLRVLGPPGRNVAEGPRKEQFCRLSEGLARRTGEPYARFALPCATADADDAGGGRYDALMSAAPAAALSPGLPPDATPIWVTRKVKTGHQVIAASMGLSGPTAHHVAVKMGGEKLHKQGLMLQRYLDPPLLQRGTFLGVPVATRAEVRIYGLVQWEPLRVWSSRYGFFRGGSPYLNYSRDAGFTAATKPSWDIGRAVESKCEHGRLPAKPAWATAEEWARCSARGAGCCKCLFVAENVDAAHDEAGFATAGTLRRLEHAAVAAGLDPRALWRSADDALTRQLAAEQARFQSEKGAKALSRWATPFCADLAFTADGRAYLYENHLFPTWKRPGYFHAIAVDRGNNLGAYSALALGMSRLLVDGTAASALHRKVVAPLRMAREQEDEALDFLETQGAAAALGFRRAWPAEAPDPVLEKVLDGRDVEFGRRLAARATCGAGRRRRPARRAGPSARAPAARRCARQPAAEPAQWCDEQPKIEAEWAAQAAARAAAGR